MSLPSITITKGQGGLGRSLPGEDYISGIIFYDNTKPAGFSALSGSSYIKEFTSLSDAVSAGIVNTYTDETQAYAGITLQHSGASGDIIQIIVTGPLGISDLGIYTVQGLSLTAEATALMAWVNTYTNVHGFTATNPSTGKINLYAPVGTGVSLNGIFPYVGTTGTISVLLGVTEFASGVSSKLAQYYYQIDEFFRLQPNGILYCMFSSIPTTYFATEIQNIQQFAVGKIRQLAIFANAKTSITTGNITAIQNAITSTISTFGVGMNVLYSVDLSLTSDLTTLPDLSTLSDNNVSVVIGQDGSAEGHRLHLYSGKSVPTLGACLGTVALSKVSDDIAWVGSYNLSDGTELEVAGFANGQLFNQITTANQQILNGYRYIFLRKFIGVNGTFWNDSHCAISTSSDYAYIENNRTIDKAIRGVRAILYPELNSPLILNSDGTLKSITISHFTSICDYVLENMKRNGELSAYKVNILSNQNVLATSTININIELVPLGVARTIAITIGFTASI